MAYGVDIPEPSRSKKQTRIEDDISPLTPQDEFDEGTLSFVLKYGDPLLLNYLKSFQVSLPFDITLV